MAKKKTTKKSAKDTQYVCGFCKKCPCRDNKLCKLCRNLCAKIIGVFGRKKK